MSRARLISKIRSIPLRLRKQKAPPLEGAHTTPAEEGLARRGIRVLRARAVPLARTGHFTREVLSDLKKRRGSRKTRKRSGRSYDGRKRVTAEEKRAAGEARQRKARIEAKNRRRKKKAEGRKPGVVESLVTQFRERVALRKALKRMLRAAIKERARTPSSETEKADELDRKITRLQNAIRRTAPSRGSTIMEGQ
ncbi:hypothetical protein N9Z54_07585 [Planctomycetota bacterium]|nr:hypothetical protein [Planctomycetota bacterium]